MYQRLTRRGYRVTFVDIDDMTLWQIGALLGLDTAPIDDSEAEVSDVQRRFADASRRAPSPNRKG